MSSVCRVCLVSNVKMFSIDSYYVREPYERLTNTNWLNLMHGPQTVCYICQSLLQKYNCFLEMATHSENILDDLFSKGIEATHENISKLHTVSPNLSTTCVQVTDYIDDTADPLINEDFVTVKIEPMAEAQTTDKDYQAIECTDTTNYNNISYCCDICKKIFTHKTSLISHIRWNHDKKSHTCTQCRKSFPYKRYLISHMRSHSQACSKCDKKFTSKRELQAHKRTHNNQPFACSQCDKKFSQKHILIRHTLTHTGEKPYTCNICDRKFTQNNNLATHMLIHRGEIPHTASKTHNPHKESTVKESVIELTLVKEEPITELATIKKEPVMELTMVTEEPVMDLTLVKTEPITIEIDPIDVAQASTDYYFELDIENTGTNTKRKSHKIRAHSCGLCDKKFTRKSILILHMRTHTGEKPYNCTICDKRFTRKGILKEHVRTHAKEKPYPCTICQKKFTTKGILKVHVKTHTGEKAFACSLCDKKFVQNVNLKTHMRTHNPEINLMSRTFDNAQEGEPLGVTGIHSA